MADEAEETPEETQDAAAPETDSAAQVDWDSDDNPYVGRFKDTQAELTRRSQHISELENPNSEAFQQFLTKHGYELAEENDDNYDEYEDPSARELQELKQWKAQVDAERAQTAFTRDLDKLATDSKETLTDRDREVIEAVCFRNGATPDALKRAFEERVQDRKAFVADYVKDKKNTPRVPRTGTEATERPDLSDDAARVQWMTEQYQQARQQ